MPHKRQNPHLINPHNHHNNANFCNPDEETPQRKRIYQITNTDNNKNNTLTYNPTKTDPRSVTWLQTVPALRGDKAQMTFTVNA